MNKYLQRYIVQDLIAKLKLPISTKKSAAVYRRGIVEWHIASVNSINSYSLIRVNS